MAKIKVSWIVQFVYAKWIRAIILRQINNPDVTWDDAVLKWLDKLFKYQA